jgi:hypothetical protein
MDEHLVIISGAKEQLFHFRASRHQFSSESFCHAYVDDFVQIQNLLIAAQRYDQKLALCSLLVLPKYSI